MGALEDIREKPDACSAQVAAVTVGNVSTVLAAFNAKRMGLIISNVSGAQIWLRLGGTVTQDVYTKRLANNEDFVLLYRYTGLVTALRASGAGLVMVTELIA